MPLALLFATPTLNASYDATSELLVLDWYGPVTLPAVQVASVQLAQFLLTRRYERVLVNTPQAKAVGPEIAQWVRHHLLPGLLQAGIQRVAWLNSVPPANGPFTPPVRSRLPAAQLRFFTEVTQATAWLHRLPEVFPPTAPGAGALQVARLRRGVTLLHWRVLTALARHPLWELVGQ